LLLTTGAVGATVSGAGEFPVIAVLIDGDAVLTLPAASAALAVSVWVPVDRALVVMLQAPAEFVAPVPTTVFPS
jgi:hypothetical protein